MPLNEIKINDEILNKILSEGKILKKINFLNQPYVLLLLII